ncbi:MAG: SprB repeat-containing protein [Cyclobacteriaceae bacterium]
MKIKSLILMQLIASGLFWVRCGSSVEEPVVDCSLSDLSITVAGQVNSDCGEAGSITVSASGGTGSYLFSTNGGSFQASSTLSGLFAGNYTLIVRDSDGCTAETATTLMAEPGAVTLSLESTNSICGSATGSITAVATGGVQPYAFSLNNGSSQSSNQFVNIANGSNTVTVLDSDGCEISAKVVVSSGISLSSDIMPIISANCAITGCHNGSRSPDLRTSSAVRASAFGIRSRTSSTSNRMPPADRNPLNQSDIDKIACWVDDGAPDN